MATDTREVEDALTIAKRAIRELVGTWREEVWPPATLELARAAESALDALAEKGA